MTTKTEQARRAIARVLPVMHAHLTGRIIAALDDEGLLNDNDGVRASAAGKTRLERVQAEIERNPSAASAMSYALGALRSRGIVLEDFADNDATVALAKLDKAMAAASIDSEKRMTIKTGLARCGLID